MDEDEDDDDGDGDGDGEMETTSGQGQTSASGRILTTLTIRRLLFGLNFLQMLFMFGEVFYNPLT